MHRTAGDTERRYHLRYYKTGTCVYDTDSKGHCVKNGPHCAFAHGALDMRPPVYDSTEMQPSIDFIDKSATSPSAEKDKVLAEDPRWMGKSLFYNITLLCLFNCNFDGNITIHKSCKCNSIS